MKRILFLGYSEPDSLLVPFLKSTNNFVEKTSEMVDDLSNFDLVLSYGYKHILKSDVLNTAESTPINLHISYLPFNRGMHPNFWAHFDNTPSGVSIHQINSGIDTGPIILQKKVKFHPSAKTFRQTWAYLKIEIENLFIANYDEIINHQYKTFNPEDQGTFHLASQLPTEFRGWDSEISEEISRLRKISAE